MDHAERKDSRYLFLVPFARQVKKQPKEKIELTGRRVIDTLDRMSEIFLPRDPLLKSAGMFPVFYWLIRQSESRTDQHIREFLNTFEKTRKENRGKRSDTSARLAADNELMTFDRLNRSPDDEQSHMQRHRVLEKRFREYLKSTKK